MLCVPLSRSCLCSEAQGWCSGWCVRLKYQAQTSDGDQRGDHSKRTQRMTWRPRRCSWANRLLPFRRDEAADIACRPAENARYSPRLPLPRLTSREMVEGRLFNILAISENDLPAASPRLISSRSRFVRRRYVVCCIRMDCTHSLR